MAARSLTGTRTAAESLIALIVAVAAVVASAATNEERGSGAANGAAGKPTVVKVKGTAYGPILVNKRGRALYLFTKDKRGPSRCYGACATAWPPFIAYGNGVVGKGAKDGLLGTRRRNDGSRQVTYDGRPLYFYVRDRKRSQVSGQGTLGFGGRHIVVRRSGRPVS